MTDYSELAGAFSSDG